MNRTNTTTLILASSSPRRQELIRSLQLPVAIKVSDVDENVPAGWEPAKIVEELSLRKARAVKISLTEEESAGGIVIGSDTIVVLDNDVLGKPKDKADAARMLSGLQGRTHQVYSGVACLDLETGRTLVSHRATEVRMKPLTETQINRYIETGEPMDKAGSYAIQGIGATIVEGIVGDYFNVVGLPVSLLRDMLLDLGVEVL